MKKVALIFILVLSVILFISKESKYSEMENFKKQAAAHKMQQNKSIDLCNKTLSYKMVVSGYLKKKN
jgi:hypothetical protein